MNFLFLMFIGMCWSSWANTVLLPGDVVELDGTSYVIEARHSQGTYAEILRVSHQASGQQSVMRVQKIDLRVELSMRNQSDRIEKMRRFYDSLLDPNTAQSTGVPILFPEKIGLAVKKQDAGFLSFAVELFPVMEGSSLDLFVKQNLGPLKEPTLRAMFDQINSALVYMNDRGIMHGDVKPENIVFRKRNSTTYEFFLIDLSPHEFSSKNPASRPTTQAYKPYAGIGYPRDIWSLGLSSLLMFSQNEADFKHNLKLFSLIVTNMSIATMTSSQPELLHTTPDFQAKQKQFYDLRDDFLHSVIKNPKSDIIAVLKASTTLDAIQRVDSLAKLGLKVSRVDPSAYWCHKIIQNLD
jgi:serine/threonine protein kinase